VVDKLPDLFLLVPKFQVARITVVVKDTGIEWYYVGFLNF
jgi:hypothetical protein